MLSTLIGFIVACVSLWGMWRWRTDLWMVLRGFLPLCFFLGGVIAMVIGISRLTGDDKHDKLKHLEKTPS
ncbi:MAG TPA: hypothetical protein P5079_06585 [Elusimicrobiota bacterium]|nr:hypothetical protein [Elusimicrobiota bacterium]